MLVDVEEVGTYSVVVVSSVVVVVVEVEVV